MNPPAPAIWIVVNGAPRSAPLGQPVDALVAGLDLPPQTALVEHNGRALLRAEWRDCLLAEGDRLEILRIVAGG